MQRSEFLKSCLALASVLALPVAQAATATEQLSAGQFTVIAPFPAGGPVDILARILATGLTEHYKQAAIVDNRPGASGNIGIDMVKRAKPDGHTLLVVPQGNLTINPTLMPKLPYSVFGDFVPVASMGRTANVIAVNPQVPAKSVQELVALSKAKPNSISYASPGVGSSLHLAGELFKDKSGADIMHVAYKGSTQGVTDVLGGTIPMIVANLPTVLPHVQSGKLRALAVTTARRSTSMPDVPTMEEAGIKGYEVSPWFAAFVPAGTPPAIVKKLNQTFVAAMKQPDVIERFQAIGAEVVGSTPEEAARHLQTESQRWTRLINERGIHMD